MLIPTEKKADESSPPLVDCGPGDASNSQLNRSRTWRTSFKLYTKSMVTRTELLNMYRKWSQFPCGDPFHSFIKRSDSDQRTMRLIFIQLKQEELGPLPQPDPEELPSSGSEVFLPQLALGLVEEDWLLTLDVTFLLQGMSENLLFTSIKERSRVRSPESAGFIRRTIH